MTTHHAVESPYAWTRLVTSLLLSTIGGVGMWSVVVALPAVQADFGVARGAASFSYTLTMIGFGFGSILLGKLSDRYGVMLPVIVGTLLLGAGFVAAALAPGLGAYAWAQGLLIGVGSAATFSPLLAHVSQWFDRRRGIAVAIFASGNYLAGAVWPPIVQHFIASDGWRSTYFGIGAFCFATMLPLTLLLKRPAPLAAVGAVSDAAALAAVTTTRPRTARPGAATPRRRRSPGASIP